MLSRKVYVLGLIPVLLGVIVQVYVGLQHDRDSTSSAESPHLLLSGTSAISLQLCFCAVISLLGYFATVTLIPSVKPLCLKAGLFGRDINKNSSDKVPESLGIVPATLYVVCAMLFQPFFQDMLGEYNAALTSMCFMLFLGFADDVLDLRWRYKLSLSFLGALPLLVAYSGSTSIVIPLPLQPLLGISVFNLGILYHLYMLFLAVFCTNSINIYAGINGLETGQSFVIGCAIFIHNVLQLGSAEASNHLLSIFLILPFISTTLGLMYYNWYPSSVFVGDTYTYFAGMTFAVVGILGHFSKTLMLFFIPQMLNFLISLPQLLWLPCPRHRLPRYDPETGLLHAIPSNLTLINVALLIMGPTTEKELGRRLCIFQALCCSLGFLIRYQVAEYFF